ncbi:MAG TPA: hypothetical protein VET85_16485 [Stellaceae bacterium]|nr:hypothetical protein [Stellaceae bacterium]
MAFRFRLIPLAMVASIGLLGMKLGNLWLAFDPVPVKVAHAQTSPEKPSKPEKSEKPATSTATPAPAASTPKGASAAAPVHAGDKPGAIDPLSISPSEVELLQKLAERRAELDRRAAELSQREVLLQAAEKRIDEKIAKLASLEKDIGGIVDKQSAEDDARIKSLVKIYETMKPQDAARIFEQLDMPVLLGVLEHMKELKVAPILAALDPAKARAVTLAVAERRNAQSKPDAVASKAPEKTPAKP